RRSADRAVRQAPRAARHRRRRVYRHRRVDYHRAVNRLILAVFFATRLPTGVMLDPVAPAHKVGSFPTAIALAPEGDRAAILLCGYREQGVQIIDTKSGAVTQTLDQPAAFTGLAFAPDGKMLYASGGNEDAIYTYRWSDRQATAAGKIVLCEKPD